AGAVVAIVRMVLVEVTMITRTWRGWTATEADGDAYVEFLRQSVFPGLAAIAGFRGATVLRRRVGDEVEFVVLTQFESREAVARFAGDGLEQAVIEPEARALLSRFDGRVALYDTVFDGR